MKIPVKEVLKELDVYGVGDQILKFLRGNVNEAYTVRGIMVECFNISVKEIEIFQYLKWSTKTLRLYGKINRALKRLIKNNLILKRKEGRAWHYYTNMGGKMTKQEFKRQLKELIEKANILTVEEMREVFDEVMGF